MTQPAPHLARTVLVFWGRSTGRLCDLGEALGGTVLEFYDPRLTRKPLVPLRYAKSAWQTLYGLLRLRPGAVIVTNPPIFAPLCAAMYCRLRGASLVLDSHPDAFGIRGWVWRLFVPVHRRLAARASATLVTTDELAATVRAWGGTGLLVHEPPPPVRPRPPRPPQRPPRVLIVTTFSVDEPVAAIMDAANLLTGCDVRVTGDLARAPVAWPQAAAAHVTFTGWLSTPDYLDELRRADVVVGLTVDEQSVMRCAYEAIYLECVTVLSDTPVARRYFSPGVFCLNEGPAIAAGVRSALEDHALWRTRAGERRRTQLSRWVRQLDALAQILSSPAPGRAGAHRGR